MPPDRNDPVDRTDGEITVQEEDKQLEVDFHESEQPGSLFGLQKSELKELLLRCTLNVQFMFSGELYRQSDGVAMGSSIGPLLADAFMGKLES
ncbi:uncharacterized protein DEA37_0009321 [Paragonimus westermani]|uniref:Reverse transcriptase domain-containing protein n=1 Tax=Paragonimus westermani TaxID=34504 RepID=A0A5J4NNV7_9TREM|nr:uncharacterized protein DEA37_0009321 [Paragonimus westermani]